MSNEGESDAVLEEGVRVTEERLAGEVQA